jgi:hypothetical protein
MQQKTQRPVQFEITEQTRDAVYAWIRRASLRSEDFLFPSRVHESPHLSTRQYARIVDSWVREIGLDPAAYGTHTLRRTKASLIYRRTKNLRAVPHRIDGVGKALALALHALLAANLTFAGGIERSVAAAKHDRHCEDAHSVDQVIGEQRVDEFGTALGDEVRAVFLLQALHAR